MMIEFTSKLLKNNVLSVWYLLLTYTMNPYPWRLHLGKQSLSISLNWMYFITSLKITDWINSSSRFHCFVQNTWSENLYCHHDRHHGRSAVPTYWIIVSFMTRSSDLQLLWQASTGTSPEFPEPETPTVVTCAVVLVFPREWKATFIRSQYEILLLILINVHRRTRNRTVSIASNDKDVSIRQIYSISATGSNQRRNETNKGEQTNAHTQEQLSRDLKTTSASMLNRSEKSETKTTNQFCAQRQLKKNSPSTRQFQNRQNRADHKSNTVWDKYSNFFVLRQSQHQHA